MDDVEARWSSGDDQVHNDGSMGMIISTVCNVLDEKPERKKFSKFGKVKFGGDAQNIWSIPVPFVCKRKMFF